MIRAFENTEINSAFPPDCANVAKIYGVRMIFFLKRTYSFASLNDFYDVAIWIQGVKDKNIIPLFDCKTFVDNSDPDPLEPNGQDYLYLSHKGKYKFVHQFNYNYEFARNIKAISQGDFDYIFVDRNGQMVAYTPDGIEVRGFDTDSITVEKLNIGTGQKANTTNVTVELSESDQLDLNAIVFKQDWSIGRNLRLVAALFSEMVLSSMIFHIRDAVFGKPISHLSNTNFIIDDVGGVFTFGTFKNLGDGDYYLNDFSSPPVSGEVVIDSSVYYGSGAYGTLAAGTITIFSFVRRDSLTRGFIGVLVLDGDSNPILGLGVSDFSLDSGTVLSVFSYGSGIYQVNIEKTPITTGTLYMDNGNITANTLYDFTAIAYIDSLEYFKLSGGVSVPFTAGYLVLDPSGTYVLETGKYRIVTTVSGDAYSIGWAYLVDGIDYRITINISAISAGTLKFQNGVNIQSYTTSGIKSFDWTADGSTLLMYTNTVNCLISDFQIAII